MPRQLVQGLVAVLDGAEADLAVALCFGRMQLPQRDHGLAVALLIERNRGAKTAWIVIHVRTVINLDQARRLDAPKPHSIRKSLAVGGEHVEAPHAADAKRLGTTTGVLVASVPDLISVLDSHTGGAVSTEQLRYGQRVDVVACPCDARWRTPAALAVVGPGAFGYEVDYRPVEDVHAAAR